MKVLIGLIISVSFISNAHADFLEPKAAAKEFGLKSGLESSVIPVQVYAFQSRLRGDCSAVKVSNDGYLLTAAHCVESCMIANDGIPKKDQIEDLYHQFSHVLGIDTCVVNIGGLRLIAKVEVTNPCTVHTTNMVNLAQHFPKEIAMDSKFDSCKDFGDIALVKIQEEDLPTIDNLQCMPIEMELAPTGASILSLGFPMATSRVQDLTTAKDSDGAHRYASVGEIVKQHYCTQANGKGEVPLQPGTDFLSSLRYQITADNVFGNSGGPLVSKAGSVIGVITSGDEAQDQTHECRGGSFATPMKYLAINAKAWNPTFNMNQVKCRAKTRSKRGP